MHFKTHIERFWSDKLWLTQTLLFACKILLQEKKIKCLAVINWISVFTTDLLTVLSCCARSRSWLSELSTLCLMLLFISNIRRTYWKNGHPSWVYNLVEWKMAYKMSAFVSKEQNEAGYALHIFSWRTWNFAPKIRIDLYWLFFWSIYTVRLIFCVCVSF